MQLVPLALRRDPVDVLACLAAEPGAFALDVPDAERPVTLFGCAPRARLTVHADGRVARSDGAGAPDDPLAAIEAFVGEAARDDPLPFPLGGVIGYLAYELGEWIERPRDGAGRRPDHPLAVLSRYDPMLVRDQR